MSSGHKRPWGRAGDPSELEDASPQDFTADSDLPAHLLSEVSERGGKAAGLGLETLTWSEPRAHTCTPCFQKAWSRPPTIAGRKAGPVTLGYHVSLHSGPRASQPPRTHSLHSFRHGDLRSSKPPDWGSLWRHQLQRP